MSNQNFDTYDFLINDEDEVMLLIYTREGEPKDSRIEINMEEKSAVLARNESDVFSLSGIPDEVLDALQDADKLLVCELNLAEDEKDSQIVYAYEAEITD